MKVTKKVRSYKKGTKLRKRYQVAKKGTKLRKRYEVTKMYEKGTKLRKRYEDVTKDLGCEVTKLRDSNATYRGNLL